MLGEKMINDLTILEEAQGVCRRLSRSLVHSGLLEKRSNCENCSSSRRVEMHHPDYNKPYKVNWFCQKCHTKWHKKNLPIYPDIEVIEPHPDRFHYTVVENLFRKAAIMGHVTRFPLNIEAGWVNLNSSLVSRT